MLRWLNFRNVVIYIFLIVLVLFFAPVLAAEIIQTSDEAIVGETREAVSNGAGKLRINGILFEGQDANEEDSLMHLVQDAIGKELTIQELQQAVDKITNYYHEHGYFLAKAYLPRQAAADGVIKIAILTGKYGDIKIENQSWVSQKTILAMLGDVHSGNVIRQYELERAVLLLNDTPGIKAEAIVQPGTKLGTADIVIAVKPDRKQAGSISIDNYGYSFTGKYQTVIDSAWNHLLAERDRLSINVLASGKLLSSGNFMYQSAVGTSGAKLTLNYVDMNYQLGESYEALGVSGRSRGGEAAFHYPLLRSYQQNLNGFLGYFHRRNFEKWAAVGEKIDKDVQGVQAGVYGITKFTSGMENTYSLSAALGKLTGASNAGGSSGGKYIKGNAVITSRQPLSNATYLSFAATWQLANKNLDSSEKMIVSGPLGVRAYAQGEVLGDEGYVVTTEIHRVFAQPGKRFAWELIALLDYGGARINKSRTERETLSGAGIGISLLHAGDWAVRADYAWKMRDIEGTDRQHGQFWLKGTSYY